MTGNGSQDPRITSLEEARRRKAEKAKAAKRAGSASGWAGAQTGPTSPRTLRDWLIGGAMIAMAVAALASFIGTAVPTSSEPAPAGDTGEQPR